MALVGVSHLFFHLICLSLRKQGHSTYLEFLILEKSAKNGLLHVLLKTELTLFPEMLCPQIFRRQPHY